MHALSTFLLFLGTLSTGIAAFAHPRSPKLAPPKPVPGARALKQHHVLRSSEDTCGHLTGSSLQLAAIDIDLELTADVLGIILDLDICICISLLPLQVDIGLGLDALVPLLGLGDLNALLEAALNIGPIDGTHCSHCTYPPHATAAPSCGSEISCGWNCQPPYVKQGDQCVCPAPWTECNGVCGSFPKGCGSSTPWKRDALGKRAHISSGVALTLADAQATCGRDETVCGVYGGSPRGFECLNVNTTLESCGGCTIPSPFLTLTGGTAAATGIDCSAIPGISRVACVSGRCAVTSCAQGWDVNSTGDGCVRASTLTVQEKKRFVDPLVEADAIAGAVVDPLLEVGAAAVASVDVL
ncbi:hypothetical protein DAEQUDRAFT_725111 [Daedalea quercina L-15889]|uniref:Protein CPL1-like domain-containing protein n=1 Tax=Daedalea quercina L-15889 TaxID=1314783 RepID=A0A165RCR9_9APHY|nr:hypothetical protein DAEQUDRAFT_725111 [Daedalea quercina L-15889]